MNTDQCLNISIIVLSSLVLIILFRIIFLMNNQENFVDYLGNEVKIVEPKKKHNHKKHKHKKHKKPKKYSDSTEVQMVQAVDLQNCINESPFTSHAQLTADNGTVVKLNNGFNFFWWDGNSSAIFSRNNLQPSTYLADYRTTIFTRLKLDKGYKMRIWRWWSDSSNTDIICPRPPQTIDYEGTYRLDLLGPIDMDIQCTTGIHGVWVGKETDPFPDYPRATYLGYSVSG